MELLDLLEERVRALVSEVKTLRIQNAALQNELSSCSSMTEGHRIQTEKVQAEMQKNAHIKQRLDALLQEVQNILPQ